MQPRQPPCKTTCDTAAAFVLRMPLMHLLGYSMNVLSCRIKIAQEIHLAADCAEIPLSAERVPGKQTVQLAFSQLFAPTILPFGIEGLSQNYIDESF